LRQIEDEEVQLEVMAAEGDTLVLPLVHAGQLDRITVTDMLPVAAALKGDVDTAARMSQLCIIDKDTTSTLCETLNFVQGDEESVDRATTLVLENQEVAADEVALILTSPEYEPSPLPSKDTDTLPVRAKFCLTTEDKGGISPDTD